MMDCEIMSNETPLPTDCKYRCKLYYPPDGKHPKARYGICCTFFEHDPEGSPQIMVLSRDYRDGCYCEGYRQNEQ